MNAFLLEKVFNLNFKIAADGGSTAILHKLFQWLIALTVKKSTSYLRFEFVLE